MMMIKLKKKLKFKSSSITGQFTGNENKIFQQTKEKKMKSFLDDLLLHFDSTSVFSYFCSIPSKNSDQRVKKS